VGPVSFIAHDTHGRECRCCSVALSVATRRPPLNPLCFVRTISLGAACNSVEPPKLPSETNDRSIVARFGRRLNRPELHQRSVVEPQGLPRAAVDTHETTTVLHVEKRPAWLCVV
jgi:hypothetical protein